MSGRRTPGWVNIVFILHALATLAAALVLAVFPAAIPLTVGIALDPDEYLLSYFLAAAELGVAVLSIGAVRLESMTAIRLIAIAFAVFHGATAVLEIWYLVSVGFSPVLVANIVIRIVAGAVFGLIWWKARR